MTVGEHIRCTSPAHDPKYGTNPAWTRTEILTNREGDTMHEHTKSTLDRAVGETGSNLKDIIYAYLRSQGASGPYWIDESPVEMWWLPDLGGRTFIEVVGWLVQHEQVETYGAEIPDPRYVPTFPVHDEAKEGSDERSAS